jgi:Tc5 transposase-like DNA-binding protein
MSDETILAAAMVDLANQKTLNYAGTARKYGDGRMTLTRRFNGETLSADIAYIERRGHLSVAQEAALIDWIHTLTARKLPPTPAHIRSYIEHLISHPIGEHWVSRFLTIRRS